MRPVRPLKPGGPISASEHNRGMEQVRRAANPTASAGTDRFRGPLGDSVRDASLPDIWVKITGPAGEDGSGGSGSAGESQPFHYDGIQLLGTRDDDPPYEEVVTGFQFDATFPLVEISGRDDVPDGAVVKAFPHESGGWYEFKFGTEEGGSGSGDGSFDGGQTVDVGCGLDLDESHGVATLSLKVVDLAGCGLEVDPDSACGLKVKTVEKTVVTNVECVDGEIVLTTEVIAVVDTSGCL